VLEGFPHNKVHNYIGGVGPLDPGPYGYMTNFLSPVDPIFFLHHANMDRLWDVWTRKQKALKKPWLPAGQDLKTLSEEPFLFFVDGNGGLVGTSTAGEYLNMERFEYEYEPGFGEDVIPPSNAPVMTTHNAPAIKGILKGNIASVALPAGAIKTHLAATRGATLIAQVTLPRPTAMSAAREFDVIVGAPPDVTHVDADSPYYAGTISFFGKMTNMVGMAHDATFAVPLPKAPEAFHALNAAPNVSVTIRVVPSQGQGGKAPIVKSLKVQML
jgi:tyrosinase